MRVVSPTSGLKLEGIVKRRGLKSQYTFTAPNRSRKTITLKSRTIIIGKYFSGHL